MMASLREMLSAGAGELGLTLAPTNIDRLLLLVTELRKWNRVINLTTITSEQEIIVKHLLDSLTVVPLIPNGARVLDLGSGGGFPGVPLALVRPDLCVTSVDATLKKIHFQRHIVRLLGLANLNPLHARGELLAGNHAGRFDVILSRAFSSLPDFVAPAQPLLASDGIIIAMKGKNGEEEAAATGLFLEKRRLALREVHRLRLPFSNDQRTLVVISPW